MYNLTSSLARVLLALVLGTAVASSQVSVLTSQGDIGRTNANTLETTLSPASVNSGNFQELFSSALDGSVLTQPLYVPGVQIGEATSNVLVVATSTDDVYALDADTGLQLWHVTLLDAAHGSGLDAIYAPSLEIDGTPVIDLSTGTSYLIGATSENGYAVQRIHALDLTSGAEKFGGPTTLQATVSGTGIWCSPRVCGRLARVGSCIQCRRSTTNGSLDSTPDGTGSGIWMSGSGLAADVADSVNQPFGRMFVATGNGSFNAVPPFDTYRNFGDDIVRLDLTGGVPTPQDSFTVDNQLALSTADLDLGAGGIAVLPDAVGSAEHPHLLVEVGKSGNIFLVDRDNMSGFNQTDMIVQELDGALAPYPGMYVTAAYWNGNLYFRAPTDFLKSFSIANGLISPNPTSVSTDTTSYPGTTPTISANGNADGIV